MGLQLNSGISEAFRKMQCSAVNLRKTHRAPNFLQCKIRGLE